MILVVIWCAIHDFTAHLVSSIFLQSTNHIFWRLDDNEIIGTITLSLLLPCDILEHNGCNGLKIAATEPKHINSCETKQQSTDKKGENCEQFKVKQKVEKT